MFPENDFMVSRKKPKFEERTVAKFIKVCPLNFVRHNQWIGGEGMPWDLKMNTRPL
jgi:hypothetical protein